MDVYAASQTVTIFSKPTYFSISSSYIPLEYSLEDSLNKTRFHLVNKVKKKKINIREKPKLCNTVHESRCPLYLQLPQDCR